MKKSDLFLESESGFMMPFVTEDGSAVQVSLGYGRQTHPRTGDEFEHSGIDYVCSHLPLYAVASGTVIGVGNDRVHDHFVVVRYGLFEVKYGHITNSFVSYGQPIVAGQPIAISGDFLHLGVKVNGETIDPNELIKILFGNISQLNALGMQSYRPTVEFDIPTKNSFEQYQDDLIPMMLRYLPQFFSEIIGGQYRPSGRTDQDLRSLFGEVGSGNYLYENVPMYGNPLGLGSRAAPLAGRFQDIIIREFLSFMATRHNVYLPQFSDGQKKKLTSWPSKAG